MPYFLHKCKYLIYLLQKVWLCRKKAVPLQAQRFLAQKSFNIIFIMKKIFLALALVLFSAASWATVTFTVNDVDFGEVSIKGKDNVYGELEMPVTWSGIEPYYYIYAKVTEGDDIFMVIGDDDAFDDHQMIEAKDNPVIFSVVYSVDKAKGAGTYEGKIRLFAYDGYDEVDKIVNLKVVVTDEAIVAKTVPFERVTTEGALKVNDTIVLVNEASKAVSGELNGAYLTAVTEGVKVQDGKANVPEENQMFILSQYGGKWQLTSTTTAKRLCLDVTGSGAFTFENPVPNEILAGWGISFDSKGHATLSRGDEDETFPVWFNSDRFKPYKNDGSYDYVYIYKKAGNAEEIKSSVTISPATIAFEDTEMEEKDSVVVTYTAENLTDDIIWSITGEDATLFDIIEEGSNDRKSGTLTIKYKGNGSSTGAVTANLAYLTQDVALDPMEDSYPISLTLLPNTIKLTKLEFVGAPTEIVSGGTLDLKPFVEYTPNDAADKSLTWTTDHDYQGTVEDGVLTAKHVTGKVVVTATSVRVPSVSASIELTIVIPPATGIELDKKTITAHIGDKDTIHATIQPEGAKQDVQYTSRNTNVVSVNKSGALTFKALSAEGVWVVVACKENEAIKDSCLVKVVPVEVESITLPATAELPVGATLQLDPTVTPAQAKDEYTITYESKNPAVATVDENGKVSAVAEGTAEITATITEGKSATITITVVGAKYFDKVTDASALGVNDTIILVSPSLMMAAGAVNSAKGSLDTITEGVMVTDEKAACAEAIEFVLGGTTDAFTLQISNSTLNSSDGSKLTTGTKNNTWSFEADENGVIVRNTSESTKAICYNSQSKYIRLYAAGVSSTPLYVYVRKFIAPPVESVTLDKHELAMHVGDNDVTLKVTVLPKDAEQGVEWKSLDATIATVSENGKVHAVAEGTTKIVVTSKENAELTDTCVVTISEWKVESITLDCDDEETIEIGESFRITPTVEPTAHTFEISYSSNPQDIVEVSPSGLVRGVAEGKTVVTVTAGDKSAQVTVTVIKPEQGIDDVESNAKVVKIVRDGHVLIIRNGEVFTVEGQRVNELKN